jgi:4-hydroxybenzoate polyprenyltransferase
MKQYLSLVKFSHTIFALPFAIVGFCLGTLIEGHAFQPYKFALVLMCMVTARSAAMAFNRYLDRDIDELNPRTKIREIPAGVISPQSALIFVLICCGLFIACTYFINSLCFMLSPVALAVILGYSYMKRISALCHIILGIGLGLAPVGSYLAVTGSFAILPILYGCAVLCWVSGFDIIYALQDDEFDKSLSLHSIPVALGRVGALRLSKALHVACAIFMSTAAFQLSQKLDVFNVLHVIGLLIFISMLVYQHTLVKINDLSKVNIAFFTTNGIASCVYGLLFLLDIFC